MPIVPAPEPTPEPTPEPETETKPKPGTHSGGNSGNPPDSDKKGGCGSMISGAAVLVMSFAGAGACLTFRKKKTR